MLRAFRHISQGGRQKGEKMSLIDIAELYKNDESFKDYIDKYAKHHSMLLEDAFRTIAVNQYAEYVKGKEQ